MKLTNIVKRILNENMNFDKVFWVGSIQNSGNDIYITIAYISDISKDLRDEYYKWLTNNIDKNIQYPASHDAINNIGTIHFKGVTELSKFADKMARIGIK